MERKGCREGLLRILPRHTQWLHACPPARWPRSLEPLLPLQPNPRGKRDECRMMMLLLGYVPPATEKTRALSLSQVSASGDAEIRRTFCRCIYPFYHFDKDFGIITRIPSASPPSSFHTVLPPTYYLLPLPSAELVMEFKRFNFCTLTLQSLHSLSQWRAQSRSGRTSRTAVCKFQLCSMQRN